MKTIEEEVERAETRRWISPSWVPIVLGTLAALAVLTLASLLPSRSPGPLREGVLVTQGPTSVGVPGGNGGGNTNMEMQGRLFPTHLEVIFKASGGSRVQIIPMDRLVEVVFDDVKPPPAP